MTRPFRFVLALAAFAFVGACAESSFTYTLTRYSTIKGIAVTLRCRDTYEVFDRYDARSLIVVTNPVNEVAVACYDGGPDLATRQREVVRIYFDEKVKRPLCRITAERDITAYHREFEYLCPDNPHEASPRLRRG